MAYKNVIFDLGKVLVDYDFKIFYETLGLKPHERCLDKAEEAILLFESGKISRRKFFGEMSQIYDINGTLENFEELWCSVFIDTSEMMDLVKEVSVNYEVFIFSNIDEVHFPFLWKNFPELHLFGENLILSYEIGAVKPEVQAYQNALEKFLLKAEETIFIDDRPVNIHVAKDLGIKGIIHKNSQETRAILTELIEI